MLSSADLQELQVPASETHLESVKRYSDFTKFHQQLLHSPLAIYATGKREKVREGGGGRGGGREGGREGGGREGGGEEGGEEGRRREW